MLIWLLTNALTIITGSIIEKGPVRVQLKTLTFPLRAFFKLVKCVSVGFMLPQDDFILQR